MFHLGATNDFLGYMVRPIEHYQQPARQGFAYLAGCPENALLAFLPEQEDACPDHWTLMVSPTIGSHVACTIQDAGRRDRVRRWARGIRTARRSRRATGSGARRRRSAERALGDDARRLSQRYGSCGERSSDSVCVERVTRFSIASARCSRSM